MRQLPLILILIILIPLFSCKTIEYRDREVPLIETRTQYVDKFVYDSIYMRDSVMLYINGDTVYKYKEQIETHYIYKTDTVIQRDSIPYPVEIIKPAEQINVLKWWQKVLMWIGSLSMVLFIVKFKNAIKKLWDQRL